MLTRKSVRQAPASPDNRYLALRNAGSTDARAGMAYVAARSAMTPAKNPRIATKRNIFNLSPIVFTFCLAIEFKPLFSLTYTFLSILRKAATLSFSWKIKGQNRSGWDV
jgi:heme O synthase-like polyprenyltransferase